MNFLKRHSLYFAWLISLIGFGMSIYFGEILKLEACRLCWYQRAALFPLTFLLGVASYRNDRGFVPYAMILAAVGEIFAAYQTLEQIFPFFRAPAFCGYVNDCSKSGFEWFGFLTFPMVSAIGFLVILFFLILFSHGSRGRQ